VDSGIIRLRKFEIAFVCDFRLISPLRISWHIFTYSSYGWCCLLSLPPLRFSRGEEERVRRRRRRWLFLLWYWSADTIYILRNMFMHARRWGWQSLAEWRPIGVLIIPALNCDSLLPRVRHVLIGDLAKRGLVIFQLTRVTKWQFCIAVQDIQHTLPYTIHEFSVTIGFRAYANSFPLSGARDGRVNWNSQA